MICCLILPLNVNTVKKISLTVIAHEDENNLKMSLRALKGRGNLLSLTQSPKTPTVIARRLCRRGNLLKFYLAGALKKHLTKIAGG